MLNVFTYGSLMFTQVWTSVITGNYSHCGATLPGYIRKGVYGADYPVIYPAPSSVVEGIIYFQVEFNDIACLDRFEGEYYQRETVVVRLEDGGETAAEAFILKEDFRSIATAREWDLEEFKAKGLARFIRSYIGFDRAGGSQ